MENILETKNKHIAPWLSYILICFFAGAGAFLLAEGCYCLSYYGQATDNASAVAAPVLALLSFLGFMLCQAMGSALFAERLTAKSNDIIPHLTVLLIYPLGVYLLYALCGEWMASEALLALCYYPSGFFLAKARRREWDKKTATLYAGIPVTVMTVWVILVHAASIGSGSGFLAEYVENLQETAKGYTDKLVYIVEHSSGSVQSLKNMFVSYGYLLSDATNTDVIKLFSEIFNDLLKLFLLLSPALLICAGNIVGYLGASLLSGFRKAMGETTKSRLTVSGFGAFLFLISATLMNFISVSANSAFSVLVINVFMIFMLPMLLVGIRTLTKVRLKMMMAHKFMTAIMVVLLVISPLMTIAMIGSYITVTDSMKRKMEAVIRQRGGDFGGFPFENGETRSSNNRSRGRYDWEYDPDSEEDQEDQEEDQENENATDEDDFSGGDERENEDGCACGHEEERSENDDGAEEEKDDAELK